MGGMRFGRSVVVLVVAALAVPVLAAPVGAATVPVVSVGSAALGEGQMQGRYVKFTVTLSQPTTVPVTVRFATGGGTATAGTDYRAKSVLLTIRAGATAVYSAVRINPDGLVEGDETFGVTLSDVTNATLGAQAVGTGTILDDDPNVGPRVFVGDVSVVQPCSGRNARAMLTLALSVRRPAEVTVRVQTADGTATAGSDYVAVDKVIRFSADQTVKEVPITLVSDSAIEGVESITVHLTLLTGDTPVSRSPGTVSIVDCAA